MTEQHHDLQTAHSILQKDVIEAKLNISQLEGINDKIGKKFTKETAKRQARSRPAECTGTYNGFNGCDNRECPVHPQRRRMASDGHRRLPANYDTMTPSEKCLARFHMTRDQRP